MRLAAFIFLMLSLATADDKPAAKGPRPKFTLGKDTTYVTGPLDRNGYIDYETALNRRLSAGIKPEDNANVLLWKVLGPKPEGAAMPAGYFKWLGMEPPPERGPYFVGLFHFMKDHIELDQQEWNAVCDQQVRAYQRVWEAKDYPHIADWLKLNEKPLDLVIEAAKRKDYYNPLVSARTAKGPGGLLGVLLPNVQKCREIAVGLAARALLRVGQGKTDEAWQDLIACHRLGRLVARGATLIETLVGLAIDQIAASAELAFLDRGKLTVKQIRGCLQDIQKLPPMPLVADRIDLGERFLCLETVQFIRRDGFKAFEMLFRTLEGLDEAGKEDTKEEDGILAAIDWNAVLRPVNHWYGRLATALRIRDRASREKEVERIEKNLEKLVKGRPRPADVMNLLKRKEPGKAAGEAAGVALVGLLLPSTHKVRQAVDRIEQSHRNLQVAFALALYRREQGRYPEKLQALAPKYLSQVPGDLFSGKELIYRPGRDGYLFYSVGVNGKDDGGRWHTDTPPGDDPNVRMPLPELKRP